MNFTNDNSVKLLRSGAEYFPALAHAINQAKVVIYLQTYIYQADETGFRIGKALKKAAERGVAVNVLLDGFGSKALPEYFIADLRQSGVKVMIYRSNISPWTLQKRRLIRMHRKVSVVDGNIGFVGGINIVDDNDGSEEMPPRLDYAVQLQGSILIDMMNSVQILWRHMSWMTRLKQISRQVSERVSRRLSNDATESTIKSPQITHGGDTKAAFIIRNSVLHRHDIEDAYLLAICAAKSEILIANAYFLPSKRFRKALLAAVIPPLLTLVKNRKFLGYSNCRGGTPPIAECGRTLL